MTVAADFYISAVKSFVDLVTGATFYSFLQVVRRNVPITEIDGSSPVAEINGHREEEMAVEGECF